VNYPGTYIAGIYNRLESTVAGRVIVNEDFVNCPNWLPITFRIGEGDWFDPNNSEILSISRKLDFRSGLLQREMVIRDSAGRETQIISHRMASMAQPNIAALKYRLTPLNYSGKISIRSGLNGDLENGGVERYRDLNSKHLEPLREGIVKNLSSIEVQTTQSKICIAQAARLEVYLENQPIDPEFTVVPSPGAVWTTFEVDVAKKQSLGVEKLVSTHTSREEISGDLIEAAQSSLAYLESFDMVLQASVQAWDEIWKKIDIRVEGDRASQKVIRLNLYHTLATASPHHVMLDAGIPARGLHGEAYRGHIFWDELYILPLYNLHFPEVTRSALRYRYNRLEQARKYALEHGYRGAMFPWQSGSDGREETQILHLNPISGEWGPDHSSLQRHVSLAIAYNIWHYAWITRDQAFMGQYGTEMFLDICRFWASIAQLNPETGRWDIDRVMGPDEYHEKVTDSERGGLKNNSYSNIMAAWLFSRVHEILALTEDAKVQEIQERLQLESSEFQLWEEIRRAITIPISKAGILEQFEGYFDLEELDWDGYRKRYGDIHRMDRILKAEGKSPDQYKVSKQADALMAFFVLEPHGVAEVLRAAGYSLGEEDLLDKNFKYYLQRTSHGSTLSKLVHSYLAELLGDWQLAWRFYQDALRSDFCDVQGGTTKEGIHTGVLAGSAFLTLRSFAGLRLDQDQVYLDPHLPGAWRELSFNFHFQGDHYEIVIHHEEVKVRLESSTRETADLWVRDYQGIAQNQRWISIGIT
jgi:trehalose/maltose hydrolase-like predicted phosphorylase